jgi:hypothetical protein
MRRVYTAADLPDAHLVLGLLQRHGIAARVLKEHARGGMGELPVGETAPEVWIDEDVDFERALAVVRAYESAPRAVPDIFCPFCGEVSPATFDFCWNCGAAL